MRTELSPPSEWLHTCTIITGEPNELREIHTRIPIILRKSTMMLGYPVKLEKTRSEGFRGAFTLSCATIWEDSHQHVHGDSPTVEREWSALKRGLMLTLEIAVGTVAIFAWTGGSL
jgi:hypothetical protein